MLVGWFWKIVFLSAQFCSRICITRGMPVPYCLNSCVWKAGSVCPRALFFIYLFYYNCYYYYLLYNIVLVLPYINMHPPRVYTCSPSWTPLPPPSPYHPSGSSQCTSPKHPVSCIEPGLVIHFLYDIIHILMPFSQIIPPPSPTGSKNCFIHLCLFCCLTYRVVVTIFLNSILYALVYCIDGFLSGLLHSV